MENLIILHLIQTFRLEKCLLPDDDSCDVQSNGEEDKKVLDTFIWQRGIAVAENDMSYSQAKLEIEQELRKCEFKKDKIILERMLKTKDLPVTILKNIRDQIMLYHLDTCIIDEFVPNYKYQIDAESSPRLKKALIKHNTSPPDYKSPYVCQRHKFC